MPNYTSLMRSPRARSSLLLAHLLLGCSSSPPKQAGAPSHHEPGTQLSPLSLSAADRAALDALETKLTPLAALDSTQLLAARAPKYGTQLGYDPKSALNLSLIQGSQLALNTQELDKLAQQGFVIAPRHAFPNMGYAYNTIYALDLPVYVSLDAILETVHLSYDAILKSVEQDYLGAELRRMLEGARKNLASGALDDAQMAQDVDLFLGVALALLDGSNGTPVRGADAGQIKRLVSAANRADGILDVDLFGVTRPIDFSQFKPRGHYEDSEALRKYFRASMWLGRTDFRMIETLPSGEQVFRRRQLLASLGLHTLVAGEARTAFDHVDQVIRAFVGAPDYMELSQLDALLEQASADELAEMSDQEVAQLIIEEGYGAQRIASQVIFRPASGVDTLPLDRSFALLGQRYVVDSHVFSNVVYDRVPSRPNLPDRYLPDPLDVAYAAFGNNAALSLLTPDLEKYQYAPHLERMRTLIDAHGADYWGENLYNLWLSTLRAASPGPEQADPAAEGVPALVGSEAWQRRMLSTQLTSWAELRHNSVLYVKQSYTSGFSCEFPDGYVDPYPEAFERLRLYALKGQEVAALFPPGGESRLAERAKTYFTDLAGISTTLRDMAKSERTGTPFNAEQMAFLNEAVKRSSTGCGGPPYYYDGWYGRLLFDKTEEKMDPIISDVHTDPGGTRPEKVLHVASGLPRLMVVTTNTCEGPRAYAGVASSYHEIVVDGLKRMADSEWAPKAKDAEPVRWMKPILP